jgi:predicted permease
MLRRFVSRLAATLSPAKSDARLQAEVEEHLSHLTDAKIARGLAPGRAALAAKREFGAVEPMKESYRDRARFRLLENLYRDIRYALRQVRQSPGFALAAVLSLALGIGANTALFSFVNTILLQHLSVPDSGRLVVLKALGDPVSFTLHQLNELNRQATRFDSIGGRFPLDISVIIDDRPEWFAAELVTGDYFRTLQIRPALGRLLTQSDVDAAAANPVCVISYRAWQSRFHLASDVLGKTIRLNTHPYKIIGVTQRGFSGIDLQSPRDIQIPATRLPDFLPSFAGIPRFDWTQRLWSFTPFARVKRNVAVTAAAAQLTQLNRRYLGSINRNDVKSELQLAPGNAGISSSNRLAKPATILLGVSTLVLLVACANLATLLLSRISARSSEFALRLAIGCSRRRILAQLFVENALLALAGTTGGLVLAWIVTRILLLFLNRTNPALHRIEITPDSHVLAFAIAASGICVLLFGTAPALQAARTAALGTSAGNTRPGTLMRKFFVLAQVTLSFVVIFAAGLLTQTLRSLQTVDLGYAADQIAMVNIRPATGGYNGAQADQFYSTLVDKVRATPGMRAASLALSFDFNGALKMKIGPSLGRTYAGDANIFVVSSGYFETLGARLLSGRDFNANDTVDKPQVYIINQHLANTYFHGLDPVGRYLIEGGHKLPIIGVVSNVRDQGIRNALPDTVYQASTQLLTSGLTLLARCNGPCAPLLPTLRRTIESVDSHTPIFDIRTVQTEKEGAFSSEEVLGFLSTLFAALAVLLTATGLYGILAYAVTRRTREVGVRVAIGAAPRNIALLFLKEAVPVVLMGTALGIPVALAAVKLLQSELYGVTPRDPVSLTASVILILVAAAAACAIPIRHALRIPPQQALRVE